MNVFSVSQINEIIKEIFDNTELFRNILIQGEISNYKKHSSGHHYFSIKDENAVISAALFKFDAMKLKFPLENGMKIIAKGRISTFPKSGQYQMYVNEILPDGLGALHIAFEKLKNTLFKKGMFDDKYKRELPEYPKKIALVTSPTSAAVRDMIEILGNRYPLCEVLVYPVKVQGEGASKEIAEAIYDIDAKSLAEIIIVGRGGGSIEDLWAFNEEIVANAIFDCTIPIISAVGHEPDVTISDYVADVRASTPSNACEIAVPDIQELTHKINMLRNKVYNVVRLKNEQNKAKIAVLNERLYKNTPQKYIDGKRVLTDYYYGLILSAMNKKLTDYRRNFVKQTAYLDAFSPLKVLTRGYSLLTDEAGTVITDESLVTEGQIIDVKLSKGKLKCEVLDKTPKF